MADPRASEEGCRQCLLALPPSMLPCPPDTDDPAHKPIPRTNIHNIVSTSVIHGSVMPIDLSQLALLLPCSKYDRRRFAAITIRIDRPKCTALLFTSGKLVITGVKSWYESLLASLCICSIIQEVMVGKRYLITNCNIQNIVAHTDIGLRPSQILNIQTMYEVSPFCRPSLHVISRDMNAVRAGDGYGMHLPEEHVPGPDIQGHGLSHRPALLLLRTDRPDGR